MADKDFMIMVINLGSTSTKAAVFKNNDRIHSGNLQHPRDEVSRFPDIWAQYDYRIQAIKEFLAENGMSLTDFDIFTSRGGNMKPVPGGIYEISEEMLTDIRSGRFGTHPTCVGCQIVYDWGREYKKPAIMLDPPITDEFIDLARVTGIPEITRQSSFHALNQKATARKLAADMGKKYEEISAIICHLGGGISVGAHRKGKAIDVNNALDGDGPMAPERAGAIPTASLINMCFSGEFTREQMLKKITGQGGWVAHLGTADGLELTKRIEAGDEKAKLVFEATVYQVAREVGACAASLEGKVDFIGLTGSLAHSNLLVETLSRYISFIAPIRLWPGENEIEALGAGSMRFLTGEEKPNTY